MWLDARLWMSSYFWQNHIGLRLLLSLAAFIHPHTLRLCRGKSAPGWTFEVKEDSKNERDYKQANMPLAVIPCWTLFSCQCFLFITYTAWGHSYNHHYWRSVEPTVLCMHWHMKIHMSLAFVSHTYALSSLTFSASHHTNHAGLENCWGVI